MVDKREWTINKNEIRIRHNGGILLAAITVKDLDEMRFFNFITKEEYEEGKELLSKGFTN